MKNYLIVGYYGYENAGDELLLKRTLELLAELDEPAFFHVLYNKKNIKKIVGKPNCRFINRWSFIEISQAIKKSDIIVFGGGGLFQDTTSAKSFLYYLGILIFALGLKKPVYFLAQGFSPIKRVWLKLIFSLIIKGVKKISVRDEVSFKTIKKLRYPLKKLTLATDLAFNHEQIIQNKAPREFIGISYRVFNGLSLNKEVLAQFLNQFDKKNLVFLNLHTPFDYEAFRDLLPLKSIAQVFNLKVQLLNNDPLPVGLKLVVGMRYHALVYAALNQVPFLALAYDQKVKNLAIAFEQEYVDLTVPCYLAEFLKKYEKLLNNLDDYQQKVEKNLQKQFALAENNKLIFSK